MVTGLFHDPTLQGLKWALGASVARHGAIAANLANVNTPGYRRVDLDPAFGAAFERALAAQDGPGPRPPPPAPTLAEDRTAVARRYDGSNVSIDRELLALADNNSRHEFVAEVLRRRYAGLRTAITGRSAG